MKPIIMSTEDVRAILDGRKTMFRLVAKDITPPSEVFQIDLESGTYGINEKHADGTQICMAERELPYKPGDVLYVREAWQEVYETEYDIYNPNEPLKIAELIVDFENLPKKCVGLSREWSCSSMPARNKYYVYAASKPEYTDEKHELKWRPSTQMPREAARLFLRVKDVRVERVQDITVDDAGREGFEGFHHKNPMLGNLPEIVWNFKNEWDARNAKRGNGWDTNCWVWVYEFERVEKGVES